MKDISDERAREHEFSAVDRLGICVGGVALFDEDKVRKEHAQVQYTRRLKEISPKKGAL